MGKNWYDEDEDGVGRGSKKQNRNSWKRDLNKIPFDLLTVDEDDLDDEEFEELQDYNERVKK